MCGIEYQMLWPMLFLSVLQTVVIAVAPGDEDPRCTDEVRSALGLTDPPNSRRLMDSTYYVNLLPPTEGAVWQQVDNDDNNVAGRGTEVSLHLHEV